MPISLHAATIPSFLQLISSARTWLDKAGRCDIGEGDVVSARLADDMLPFAYQVKSMAVHSAGAIEGVRAGLFSPDMSEPPQTLAALGERLDQAERVLREVTVEEMESFIGTDMRFEIARLGIRVEFDAEDFLLSFSQPNFYFHASAAYAILRHIGVETGKRDFLGPMRARG